MLGLISGNLGDYYCRSLHGKTVICRKPVRQNIELSKAAKEHTKSFVSAVSLCKAMNKIKVFSEAWRGSVLEGESGFHKMMKQNVKRLKDQSDFSTILLVPDEELFPAEMGSIIRDNDKLLVSFEPLTVFNTPGFQRSVSLQGVLLLSAPDDMNDKELMCIPIVSKVQDLIPGEVINFTVQLESAQYEIFKNYSARKVLLNLAVKDIQQRVILFSESCVEEIL